MASILDAYPEYASTSHLDELRRSEYGYLDEQDHVYLDYTGSGLAARAQHRAHAQRQAELVLGNPHSASPTSELATDLVETTRARILAHFNASPDEYAVVFTANATGAARLIGESYRFAGDDTEESKTSKKSQKRQKRQKTKKAHPKLVLTADNHNSLNGLREYARRQGVPTAYVASAPPDLHVDEQALLDVLGPELPLKAKAKAVKKRPGWQTFLSGVFCGLLPGAEDDADEACEEEHGEKDDGPSAADSHSHERGLFAYPAQSNFSGVRHPLAWVDAAHRRGYDVLLDAAAYLPTSPLDLAAAHRPDFVLVSWYKLFGYPTGVGCLVARRDALARLDRPWFSGGTIRAVSVGLDWHAPAHRLEARFEDGTVNFQAIPDVGAGLDWLTGAAVGGMAAVQTRVRCLTGWFLDRLVVLRHSNGAPMVRLYGPAFVTAAGTNRGGTVTFNFIDPAGAIIDERVVATAAAAARISLRTGCFCNPGAGEIALGFSPDELRLLQLLAANSKPPPPGHGHEHAQAAAAVAEYGADEAPKPSTSHSSASTSSASSAAPASGHSSVRNSGSSSSLASSFGPASSTDRIHEKAVAVTTTATVAHDAVWPIAGAVRVSFGVASNTADVDGFFAFARREFRDRMADDAHLLPRFEC